MKFLLFAILIIFLVEEEVNASFGVQTIAKLNWNITSQSRINVNCRRNNDSRCGTSCGIAGATCKEIYNYNDKVCGCQYCVYDRAQGKCAGMCENAVLDRCVSKLAPTLKPTKDSDCVCASCKASYVDYKGEDDENIRVAGCDSSTCYGKPCQPVFVRINENTRSDLECICLS